jgi:hypothetical protein
MRVFDLEATGRLWAQLGLRKTAQWDTPALSERVRGVGAVNGHTSFGGPRGSSEKLPVDGSLGTDSDSSQSHGRDRREGRDHPQDHEECDAAAVHPRSPTSKTSVSIETFPDSTISTLNRTATGALTGEIQVRTHRVLAPGSSR